MNQVDPKDFTIPYVEVWERWQKIDGVIYYEWKTPKEKEWHRRATGHRDTPWVTRSFLNPSQYKALQSKTEIEQ